MKTHWVRAAAFAILVGGMISATGCGTSVSTTPQGVAPVEEQQSAEYVAGEKAGGQAQSQQNQPMP